MHIYFLDGQFTHTHNLNKKILN